jgi:hypothetical protein
MPAASFFAQAISESRMRTLIIAGVVLAVAGCGNNDQTDNIANVDENLAAENIVTNDVTAIDAVTADAANMAADVNYADEVDNGLDNSVGNAANRTSSAARKPVPRPSRPSPTETTTNSATNAAQ